MRPIILLLVISVLIIEAKHYRSKHVSGHKRLRNIRHPSRYLVDSSEIEKMNTISKPDLDNSHDTNYENSNSIVHQNIIRQTIRIPETSNRVQSQQRQSRYLRTPCLKRSGKVHEHRTYPRVYENYGFEASLPREWDWRNVSGINYCSPNRNQHIPVYCGSCWVFGSLGALNDRFNIARKNRWPMTMLSPQEIIDCNGHGSCQGGDVGDVYGHAKKNGLVEEGCNNYKAVNGKCDAFHRCGTCWPEHCDPVQNYTRYFVKDYGKLSGRLNMMAEIQSRGPIACSIGATPLFEFNYTNGIFNEFSDLTSNHIVSVTGWGYDKESKTEYWIVRNSWGDAFGEMGWFRVVTSLFKNGRGDLYNMGIERECYFVDPDVSNLN